MTPKSYPLTGITIHRGNTDPATTGCVFVKREKIEEIIAKGKKLSINSLLKDRKTKPVKL